VKKYIGYGIVVLGLIGFLYFNSYETTYNVNSYVPYENENKSKTELLLYDYAEIKGEVRFPGVYQICENDILITLINKAGGLTENADIEAINQAQLIEKNSSIVIPELKKEDFENPESSPEDKATNYVFADIKGEVNMPGVYKIFNNQRVIDIIEAAGGLTTNADMSNINMAQEVYDGIMIVIPEKEETGSIYACIKGEVKNPGYYEISEDSILGDLIIAAGGLTIKADLSMINFNQVIYNSDVIVINKITSIEKIYVSIKGEVVKPNVYYVEETICVKDLITLAGGLTIDANSSGIDFDQTLVLGSIVVIPSVKDDDYQVVVEQSGFVNINTASSEQLQTLKGIGEILSQRIIDYRIENGSFFSIDEICLVTGIKDYIYEQIKDYITVG